MQPRVTTLGLMRYQELITTMVDLRCLEIGIIPLSSPGFLLFKGMSPDEIRVAKRKYRKLKRKLKKKLHRNPSIYDIKHHLREAAWSEII